MPSVACGKRSLARGGDAGDLHIANLDWTPGFALPGGNCGGRIGRGLIKSQNPTVEVG